RLGGFVYGTIVVLAVVITGGKSYPHEPGHVAVLVVVTTVVFWLAHVYSHALAHSVSRDEHLSFSELRDIARREASLLEAGLPPVVALLLGSIGVLSDNAAVWLAIALGLAVLAAQGIVFARIEKLGWLGTLVVLALNLALGLLLVALKAAVTH